MNAKNVLLALSFAIAVALLSPAKSQAQEWIADGSGCRVWNPRPVANESIRWSGECKDGYAEGDGILEWFLNGKPHGSTSGQFSAGKINGKATSTAANGARFAGGYVDGMRNGFGTEIRPNGTRYHGAYFNDKPHGKGKVTFTSGNVYEGDFFEGKQTGTGKLTWANGASYEGEFLDGKMHGAGLLIDPSGSRQRVQFVEGKRVSPPAVATPPSNQASTPAVDSGSGGHSLSAIRAAPCFSNIAASPTGRGRIR